MISTDERYKHRALQLINPAWNLSGNFMCSVATYFSIDWKVGKLQMIGDINEILFRNNIFIENAKFFSTRRKFLSYPQRFRTIQR